MAKLTKEEVVTIHVLRQTGETKNCSSSKSSIIGTPSSFSVYQKVARPICIRFGRSSSMNTHTQDLISRSASSLEIAFPLLPSDRCVVSKLHPQHGSKRLA